MKYYASGKEIAKEGGFPLSNLEETMGMYNTIAQKMKDEVPGAPYDAYGGGKSWDPWGKKFFHNFPVETTDSFHVAIVTPVIHYCMGGLEIDQYSRVMRRGKAMNGLYAAGEIAGGVHGNNRLGGNSLLDCVVFGRVSGKHVSTYCGWDEPTDLHVLSGAVGAGGAAVAVQDSGAAPAPVVMKTVDMSEVGKHTTKEDCWVVLNGAVLDVTKFLPDHPGGELAILTFAGKDATAEFDMIHPPDVIDKYLVPADPNCRVGVIAGSAAAAAAMEGGGAAPAAASGLGKGRNDADVWGAYPHQTEP